MRKEKPGDAYLRFLLETTAREPVNEAGFLANARDNLLSKFRGTDMGQRAQGRLDASDLARQLKREWMRFSGQQHGNNAGIATPRNIQRWLNQKYGVDIDIVPETRAAPQQQAEPQQQQQTQAEPQQTQAEPQAEPEVAAAAPAAAPAAPAPAAPAQAAPAAPTTTEAPPQDDIYADLLNAIKDRTVMNNAALLSRAEKMGISPGVVEKAQAQDITNDFDEAELKSFLQDNSVQQTDANPLARDIASLKQEIMKRLKNPDAKALAQGARSPEQYANYLRMGIQALGATDPRTNKPPFGEALTGPVGQAMAKLTTSLASGSNQATITDGVTELKSAVGENPNDQKAVEEYLSDVFSDPEFAKTYPFLRDLKKQNDEDQKFAQSPLGKLPPDRLFNKTVVKAVQYKEMKGNPSPQDQEQFTAMISALCQRTLQQPPQFEAKVQEFLDGLAADPALLKRFPTLQPVIDKFKSVQQQTAESYAPGYLSFLFETSGMSALLCEDEQVTGTPPMDYDGRLKGKLLDRFFVMLAQQLLATGVAQRDDAPATNSAPRQQQSGTTRKRRFDAREFPRILQHAAKDQNTQIGDDIAKQIVQLMNENDWGRLHGVIDKLDRRQQAAVTIAIAKASQ